MIRIVNFLLLISASFLFTCTESEEKNLEIESKLDQMEVELETLVSMGLDFDISKLSKLQQKSEKLFVDHGHLRAKTLSKTIEGILTQEDNERALTLYLDALEIAQQNEYKYCEGLLFELLGKKYFELGEYESVQNLFRLSLNIWEELDYQARIGYVLAWIGIEKERQHELDSAVHYYEKGKAIFRTIGDDLSLMASNNLISGVKNKLGLYSESIDLGLESVSLSKRLDDKWIAQAHKDLALTYKSSGNFKKAIEFFRVAIDYSEGHEVPFNNYELASVYFLNEEFKLAKKHLLYALEITNENPNGRYTKFNSNTYLLLSKVERELGNDSQALDFLIEHNQLAERLQKLNLRKESTRKASSYEAYVSRLKAEKEEKKANNHRFLNYTFLIAGIFLVLLLLVGLWFYKEKQKDGERLEAQNEIISSSLSERESLLKEIHHRVKNNLQIIASLLYLQSGKFDDEDYKKVLEEGQGRVRSMALIHQKLYENEDLKSIPFDEYLTELVTEIRASFGAEMRKVNIDINAENIQFDIDTAIPLGLIVNEMATNAFKYAFNDLDAGSFSISIQKEENIYNIKIQDDGKGIPEAVDLRKVKSLGLRLVRMLSQQLEGEFQFKTENGTSFELKFAA